MFHDLFFLPVVLKFGSPYECKPARLSIDVYCEKSLLTGIIISESAGKRMTVGKGRREVVKANHWFQSFFLHSSSYLLLLTRLKLPLSSLTEEKRCLRSSPFSTCCSGCLVLWSLCLIFSQSFDVESTLSSSSVNCSSRRRSFEIKLHIQTSLKKRSRYFLIVCSSASLVSSATLTIL